MSTRSLRRLLPVVAGAGLLLVLSAYAQLAPAPSPAPQSSVAPSASPSQAPSGGAGAPIGGPSAVVSLLSDGSEARYRVQEQLLGRSLPNTAVGSTDDVAGSIVLAADGSLVPEQSKVVVDLRSLQSDESRRDNYIKANTLQTQQFPTAEFVPVAAQGAPAGLPNSGQAMFQLLGDLTVHGVTRPVAWDVTAQFAGPTVTGQATTQVRLTDFGMTPPRVGPVLSIEDVVTLELAFQGTSSAPPAAGARSIEATHAGVGAAS